MLRHTIIVSCLASSLAAMDGADLARHHVEVALDLTTYEDDDSYTGLSLAYGYLFRGVYMQAVPMGEADFASRSSEFSASLLRSTLEDDASGNELDTAALAFGYRYASPDKPLTASIMLGGAHSEAEQTPEEIDQSVIEIRFGYWLQDLTEIGISLSGSSATYEVDGDEILEQDTSVFSLYAETIQMLSETSAIHGGIEIGTKTVETDIDLGFTSDSEEDDDLIYSLAIDYYPELHWNIGAAIDIDALDESTAFTLGGQYFFMPGAGLSISYSNESDDDGDDSDTITIAWNGYF